MKKIALPFMMILLVSCSRTTDNTQPTNPTNTIILPKKITDGTMVMNVFYDGTKINNIKRNDGVTVYYTYTGNLVTGIKFVDGSGNIVENDTYKYDTSDNLTEIDTNSNIVKKYTKQSDGRILEVLTQNNTSTSSQYLTFSGNNLMKTESITSNSNYIYDSKNSPFINVTGLTKIYDNNGTTINNQTERNISNLNGNTVISTSKFRNVISYNSSGYPSEIKVYYTGTNGVENFEKSLTYEY